MPSDYDYMTPETWGGDVLSRFAELRDEAPVFWSEKTGLFLVTRYEDVSAVSKNSKLFCSGEGTRPGNPVRLSIIDMDEPRHTQLRRLVNRGFTPRMVHKLETVFRSITTEALDAIAKRGECDFVEDVAVPLPLLLIAEMIGIRREDRERFHEWSDSMIAGDGNLTDPEVVAKAGRAFQDYSDYVRGVFEERRREPRDDLVSILVGAHDEGILGETDLRDVGDSHRLDDALDEGGLGQDELVMFMVLLLVAGNETTRNAISGGMAELIANPRERERLIANPELMPLAVEEIVRHVTPVLSFARSATEDTELRGVPIAKGEKVLLVYPSANRDPEVFDDPDRFKVDRKPNAHLGFGIGNHFCLGANLARMEIRVAFEEILRRLPDIELSSGPPEMRPSALVRSYVRMPVRFTPER